MESVNEAHTPFSQRLIKSNWFSCGCATPPPPPPTRTPKKARSNRLSDVERAVAHTADFRKRSVRSSSATRDKPRTTVRTLARISPISRRDTIVAVRVGRPYCRISRPPSGTESFAGDQRRISAEIGFELVFPVSRIRV